MDIGCSLTHSLLHQGIDQHDHWRRVDIFTDDLIFHAGIQITGTLIHLGNFLHLIGAVIAVDGHHNVAGGRKIGFDTELTGDSNNITASDIHGVVDRYQQRIRFIRVESVGQHRMVTQHIRLHQLADLHWDLLLIQTDHRQLGHKGHGFQQLFFRNTALFCHQFADATAAFQICII